MILAALLASLIMVQDTAPDRVRVFLDCPTGGCDTDYLRTEIRFIDWVRDRAVADVHVLVTTQDAGAGLEYTVTLIGLRDFQALRDTLRFASSTTDTEDERRNRLAQRLRLGLVRYLAHSGRGPRIEVRVEGEDEDEERAPAGRDRWNYWLFELGLSANLSGEESRKERSFSGSFEARRVTEQWKWEFEIDGGNSRSRFKTPTDSVPDSTLTSNQHSWSLDAMGVRSLSQHWSFGGVLEAEHSSFSNIGVQVRGGPVIEFNFFPYRESTRRILTAAYAAGVEHSLYRDTTIYDQLRETRPLHNLEVSLEVRQPWGSADASVDFTQYLHDASKVNLGFDASASFRLVRGLQLEFFGGYQIIRSQLYLAKGELDPDDVLIERRALATAYEYYTGFGVSYTFGSIYNNVVNPRLR